jgi:Ca-activated chloride channel family protein
VLEFDLPLAFLALVLPLLVYWLSPEFRDRGEAVRAPFFTRLVEVSGKAPTSGAVVLVKRRFQKIIVVLIWLLVVTALARPVWVGEPIVKETSARDMLLVVDLSGSMDTNDFEGADGERVTRLDAVKDVLEEFIARRRGDRLGLAVFGNAAYPQAPFTEDHDVVSALLSELQPRMAGPRTMIGDALGLAIRLFEASETDNKVVVMLTDGNDTGSQMPVARAARIAADNGITVHTIAMGDPATVGEDALDVPALEEISTITGGRFFLALDRDELDGVYDELDRIEPELIETLSYQPKRSLFHVPLAIAVALMGLLTLIMLSGRGTARARAEKARA